MKLTIIIASIALTILLAATASKPTNDSGGFAVLELFTSEGCSSCPAADKLLADIQKKSDGKPVFILAYHVDYWDRLGWKDAFSQPQFSERQYRYSRQLGAQVYTPQLVVNGQAEFIGSDESAVKTAINSVLDGKATATLTLQAVQQGNKIDVSYQATGNTAGCKLLLALVQKHATSNVRRGENEGRTLEHVQIVRSLHTFELAAGKAQIGFLKDCEVIGFLQDPRTGVIKGAAKAAIN